MDSYSSELIKLSSNAFLAQRISSINSIAILCSFLNRGDISKIAFGIGRDERIGQFFLQSSLGFGGSCFKKDILNLSFTCDLLNLNFLSYY
jgi:UDPglucose 6-dehydrogenase